MSDVFEHGIRFCHIPAGPFLMGSADGDPDEQPVHEVNVGEFWLSETTVSWFDFARLMGWSAPPDGFPSEDELKGLDQMAAFFLREATKIRLQYCEDKTLHAWDWHAHVVLPSSETGSSREAVFGKPPREDDSPLSYAQKPMVAVGWQDAEELCTRLSNSTVTYRLPTEAEWEKAARGGLVGCRYAWGNELPTAACCDFNRFDEFSIQRSRTYPGNGYGLYGMCGSVWEWTSDIYDALAYAKAPRPEQPSASSDQPKDSPQRVLRGGSWADGAEAVTVSFRMSRGSASWRDGRRRWGGHLAPNIGFRICRVTRG